MKKILIVTSLVALGMLGLVVYFLLNGQTKSVSETGAPGTAATTTAEVPSQPETIRGSGSLTALLALNRPLECSITYDTPGVAESITGTYFTARGMLRGDFIIPEMATGSVSSLIVRDNTLYTWSTIEGEMYGMKVDLATLEATKQSDTAPDTNEAVPLDAAVQYDCRTWSTIDNSVFAVPTDVLFTDYASITKQGMEFGTIYEEGGTDNTVQCGLCEQVEGEGRAACKAQFQCE